MQNLEYLKRCKKKKGTPSEIILKITKESEVNKLMASRMYEYGTSPRKLEPEYKQKKRK